MNTIDFFAAVKVCDPPATHITLRRGRQQGCLIEIPLLVTKNTSCSFIRIIRFGNMVGSKRITHLLGENQAGFLILEKLLSKLILLI